MTFTSVCGLEALLAHCWALKKMGPLKVRVYVLGCLEIYSSVLTPLIPPNLARKDRRQFSAIEGALLAWDFELKDEQGKTLALIDRNFQGNLHWGGCFCGELVVGLGVCRFSHPCVPQPVRRIQHHLHLTARVSPLSQPPLSQTRMQVLEKSCSRMPGGTPSTLATVPWKLPSSCPPPSTPSTRSGRRHR